MKRTLRTSKQDHTQNLNDSQKRDLEKLKQMAKGYEGKSEGEILNDLKSAVAQGKRSGALTDDKIQSLMQSVAPMLTQAQKKKLDELSRQLQS